MTLGIMALGIMELGVMTLGIVTHSVMTYGIIKLSIMTHVIMKTSLVAHRIRALSKMTLSKGLVLLAKVCLWIIVTFVSPVAPLRRKRYI
jgi:hypothetical protein